MLGLDDHAAPLVEERGRAVAPLLDVGGEGRADEDGAHLLGDGRRALPSTWSSIFTLSSRSVSLSVPPSLAPTHPGGASRWRRRARPPRAGDVDRLCRREVERRARPTSAVRTATSSISRSAIRVSVPLLVRAVEALVEAVPERHRQLERLPAVAQVGLAVARQLTRLAPAGQVRTHVVAPLVARDEPERGQHARGRPERARSAIPSSSASSHACSGPAPPNATSANPRGSWPRSTDTSRNARSISAFTTAITATGSIPSERARPPRRGRARPAGERAGSRPSSEVRVGDGRPRPAASVTRGTRIGAGALGPDAERAARVPPDDRAASGADRVQVDGRQAHRQPADRLARPSGSASPPAIRQTSVDVPPMSNEIAFAMPGAAARRAAAPTTPAAGPETSDQDGARPPPRASRPRPTSASRAARAVPRSARGREPRGSARDRRPEIRVDGRRRGALVLAELGRDLVRGDDARVRQPPPHLVRDGAFVGRIPKREQQADCDRLRVELRSDSRSSGSMTPSGPIRSRTPKQRSSGTSGSG